MIITLFAAWVGQGEVAFLKKLEGGTVGLSSGAWHAQVLRQPEGTYTAQEHALRVSPILIEPIGAYSLHCLLQWLLKIRDKRLARHLKSLQTKMKKMVHDLKVSQPVDTECSSMPGKPGNLVFVDIRCCQAQHLSQLCSLISHYRYLCSRQGLLLCVHKQTSTCIHTSKSTHLANFVNSTSIYTNPHL